MTPATAIPNAPDLTADDYVVIGLATCFLREDGEIEEVQVVEPIPSAALEALFKQIPTSYSHAIAVSVGTVIDSELIKMPDSFPAEAEFCSDFVERVASAARTYKARPEAKQLIPLGTTHTDFNYSTQKKRVLNADHIVKTEDNVKQHSYTHQVL
jgi:hypothetical protein